MGKRRAQGEGSISKRQNGKWLARYTAPNGKRKAKTFITKREATEWLTDTMADIQRGEYVAPSDITLAEWIDDFITTYKQSVAPATKIYYIECVQRLQKYAQDLLDTPLQHLTPTMLQQTVNDMQVVYAPRTVRMSIMLVRSALKKAVTLNMIRVNPADELTLPVQVITNGGKHIPAEDMANIINWAKTTDRSKAVQAYKDLTLFLAKHGCRPGEARAIKINKIKDDWVTIDSALDRWQNLKDTKTHKVRRVPIALDCLDMVNRRTACTVNGWLFESSVGSPLQHRRLAACISEITDGKYSPYDLRHTFCTNAVAGGGNLKVISAITGHSIETLLTHYVHVTDEDLKELIDKPQLSHKTV